jgi:hypothetical protein
MEMANERKSAKAISERNGENHQYQPWPSISMWRMKSVA